MMKQKANEADQESDLREAFKIFDRDKDGFIDLKELKTVATMLGSMLTKEEVEEFMREADVVRHNTNADVYLLLTIMLSFITLGVTQIGDL